MDNNDKPSCLWIIFTIGLMTALSCSVTMLGMFFDFLRTMSRDTISLVIFLVFAVVVAGFVAERINGNRRRLL